MNIIESFRIAWTALMSNKSRALLTMLGIIIGVGAVIGMLSIGNGMIQAITADFERLGAGVFYVSPQVRRTDANDTQQPRLTASDAEAIRQSGITTAVKDVAISYSSNGIISAGRERYSFVVQSVTPNYFVIGDNQLKSGSYFTDSDDRARARVALLGSEVASTLFGSNLDPVGRRITIDNVTFQVIGVLENQPSLLAPSFNGPETRVYVPYQTGRARLFRNSITSRVDVDELTVQALNKDQVELAMTQTTELLRQRHRLAPNQNTDFTVSNPADQLATINAVLLGLNGFLGLIAGIALLVGGIGIMNIMLVSVTQRTREIGLRKAVGAPRRAILQQFLIESLVLCLVGGLLGVVLGYLLTFAGTYVIQNVFLLSGAEAVVNPSSIVLAMGISTATGIMFGFWPAWRASRLQPVQALRSE